MNTEMKVLAIAIAVCWVLLTVLMWNWSGCSVDTPC